MRDVFEKLGKILNLEHDKGYSNTAVIGGLEGFMEFWYKQARAKARTPDEIHQVDGVISAMRGYGGRDPAARREAITQSLTLMGLPLPGQPKGQRPAQAPRQAPTARPTPPTQQPQEPPQPAQQRPVSPPRERPLPPQGAPRQGAIPFPQPQAKAVAPSEAAPRTPERPPAEPETGATEWLPPAQPSEAIRPEPEAPPASAPQVEVREAHAEPEGQSAEPSAPSAPALSDDLFLEDTSPVTYVAPEAPKRIRGKRSAVHSPEELQRLARALESPITSLPQVGGTYAKRLAKLGIQTVRDLLWHLPHRYEDYSAMRRISELMYGQDVTVVGVVEETKARQSKRGAGVITSIISDGTGTVQATWFNQPFLLRQLRAGTRIRLSGTVSAYLGRLTFQSPRYELVSDVELSGTGIIPIYPLTEQVSDSWMRRKVHEALSQYRKRIPDPLPIALREKYDLPDLGDALAMIHEPTQIEDTLIGRRRLAFDELLHLQLGVLRQRREWQSQNGRAIPTDPPTLDRFAAALPFPLTGAQQRAIGEIVADMARPAPMSRLLQGDVGAGKTVVAAAALINAAAAGYQGAMMAPTEILAEQHYQGLARLLGSTPLLGERPLRVGLLTGSTSERERRETLAALEAGELDVLVGTHALIQPDVRYAQLGVAVVDEQHRFGVAQRHALRDKANGQTPDLLVMSATPIPRSLALTLYGDLDLSILDEMPPGRTPIVTRVINARQRERAYTYIRSQVAEGRQAFIICPLVEENEKLELRSAVEEYHRLQREIFPDLKLGLLHGRMTADEKESVMGDFYRGERHILVSTSVIEVGIDVPNATVMLVESANRFGLAQLHQFRGRVGRGQHRSVCLLLADDAISAEGEQRLNALAETTDGFRLAQIDLEMRGPGDFFGKRQSGVPELSVARLGDSRTLDLARQAAAELLDSDPQLREAEHALLQQHVHNFWNRDQALPS